MKSLVEFCEFLGKNIGLGDDIELILAEKFLHLNYIVTQAIFSGEFIRLWEVVYFLRLYK